MDRHELAILKAKAKAYDCIEIAQGADFDHSDENHCFVFKVKDPARLAKFQGLACWLPRR